VLTAPAAAQRELNQFSDVGARR